MKFKASLDLPAKLITGIAILISLTLTFPGLLYQDISYLPAIIPVIIMWSVIAFCFILSPRYYLVYADRIIIKRLIRSVTIYRTDIRLCRTITKKEVGPLTRYFGVGGIFGYFGKFLSVQQGSLKFYATRQQNFVLLYTNKRKIMLSPDEPLAFTRSVCG